VISAPASLHVKRSGEFFQPETGFHSGITELVMGGENEEDFHNGCSRMLI
jgi:hypothetical protein